MTRFAFAAVLLASVAACTSTQAPRTVETNPATEATVTVAAVVANTDVQGTKLPAGVQAAMTDCIVTHATGAEIAALAAAKNDPTEDTNALVSQILAREETTTCAASKLTQS